MNLLSKLLGYGPCMMHMPAMRAFVDDYGPAGHFDSKVSQVDWPTMAEIMRTEHRYQVIDGVAVIALHGPMVLEAEPLLDYYAIDYTVTPHFAAAVSEALARDDVQRVVIHADTPGGAAHGLQEVWELLSAAEKPVDTHVDGLLCSAGLYALSPSRKITATPSSIIGSIGTMMALWDTSGYFEKFGVKVHLVSTGEHKGTGTDGVEITEAQLAPFFDLARDLASQFITALAGGRSLDTEDVKTMATGEFWIASKAVERGLADETTTDPDAAHGARITEAMADRPANGSDANSQATQSQKEQTMNKDELKQLLAANPAHAALINRLDDAGMSAEAVKAVLGEVATMQEAHTKQVAEMQATIDANAETITGLEAKVEKAKSWNANGAATVDPGSNQEAGEPAPAADLSDTGLKQRWDGMSPARQAEFLGEFDDFAYAMRHPELNSRASLDDGGSAALVGADGEGSTEDE